MAIVDRCGPIEAGSGAVDASRELRASGQKATSGTVDQRDDATSCRAQKFHPATEPSMGATP
jgi:hypothetical protein